MMLCRFLSCLFFPIKKNIITLKDKLSLIQERIEGYHHLLFYILKAIKRKFVSVFLPSYGNNQWKYQEKVSSVYSSVYCLIFKFVAPSRRYLWIFFFKVEANPVKMRRQCFFFQRSWRIRNWFIEPKVFWRENNEILWQFHGFLAKKVSKKT